MPYHSKQRKQSKLSKKNKTKIRKNKIKVRRNKRTRRFRKQYGGKLNDQQIQYIQEQIKDLGFSEEQRGQVIGYFNKISQHVSKQIQGNTTVLDAFFDNVNANYRRANLTQEQKRSVFLGLLSQMYYRFSEKDPPTDDEDDD
jgi:hypothetical protein